MAELGGESKYMLRKAAEAENQSFNFVFALRRVKDKSRYSFRKRAQGNLGY